MKRPGPLGRAILGASAIAVSMAVIGLASPALAYDGGTAASYANRWWYSRNPTYPAFTDDCTNFVSQSVHAGGFSMVGGSSSTNDYQWWVKSWSDGSFTWSHSWSVAYDYYLFLNYDVPGGIFEGTSPGYNTGAYTPNSVVTGDVLFYDWGQGAGISHTTIQVGIGTDPTSQYYGNLIDEHTTDRGDAFWSVRPYNAYYKTTTIYFMHVSSSNT